MKRVTIASLGRDIDDFLVFKRALGHSYRRSEATLRSLQRFACRHTGQQSQIDLPCLIRKWLDRVPNRKPVTRACDLGTVRQLCHFRRRRDPDCYIPSIRLAPQTESRYTPYVFSQTEIRSLLMRASGHEGRNFWPELLRLLILATYCTGLRFGEAVRLQRTDIDLEQRLFHIRGSKGRTRLVPFGADLAQEFCNYWPQREAMLARKSTRSTAVFIGRYSCRAVWSGSASRQ